MSIIHDALKKAEELSLKGETTPEPAFESAGPGGVSEKPKVYLWYVLGLCLLLFLGNTLLNISNRPRVNPVSKAGNSFMSFGFSNPFSASSQKKVAPDELSLNGVFFSQDEGFAIINGEVVSEGETVGKAKVVRIGFDEVELENEGKTIKLSSIPQ
jgi:hypothetical protein